jgi:hypothetical protein
VDGEICRGDSRVPQRPLDELAPLMQALLDDDGIEWFGWYQYTPYFNDGEPCIFNVYESLAVMPVISDVTAAAECQQCQHSLTEQELYCGMCGAARHTQRDEIAENVWDGIQPSGALGKRDYKTSKYSGPDEARFDRCLALQSALGSGAFDDVLLEHFGDHARITVSRVSIKVEEYAHD